MSASDQVMKMTKRLNLPEQLQLLESLSRMVRAQVTEAKPHSIMELEGLAPKLGKTLMHRYILTRSLLRGSLGNHCLGKQEKG